MRDGDAVEQAASAVPPKIPAEPAREIPIEVLPPLSNSSQYRPENESGPPIHALSAIVLVAIDSLWALFDLLPPVWIIAIPLCFVAVFVPVFLIQRFVKGDTPGRAAAFGTLLGVLAAIPTPITGTPVGLGLLAWTGLRRMLGRPTTK